MQIFGGSRAKGQTINVQTNTDYVISGILISADGDCTNNAIVEVIKSGVSFPIYIPKNATKPYNWSKTFNTGENTEIIVSMSGWDNDLTKTTNTIFDNIQLEQGTTATSYEPYCGGIPSPNPDFPQAIKNVTGNSNVKIQNENLYNKDNDTLNYYYNAQLEYTYSEGTNISDYIQVKENENMILSYQQNVSSLAIIRINFFNEEKTLQSQITNSASSVGLQNKTFQVPSGIKYVRFSYYSVYIDNTKIQLEYGSTDTSYAPHQEQNLPFSLKSKNLYSGGNRSFTLMTTVSIEIIEAGSYIISGNFESTDTDNTQCLLAFYKDDTIIDTVLLSRGNSSQNITLPSEINRIFMYASNNYANSVGDTATFTNIMIRKTDVTDDSYEPYYDIKAMQGTTLEDDGIHNARNQIEITSENVDSLVSNISTAFNISAATIFKEDLGYENTWLSGIALINNYHEIKASGDEESGSFATNFNKFNLYIFDDRFTDLETAKSLLIGTIIEIEQAEEEIIPYNSTQQAQYNAIKQARSYDDITIISSESDELGFKMDVESLRNKTN